MDPFTHGANVLVLCHLHASVFNASSDSHASSQYSFTERCADGHEGTSIANTEYDSAIHDNEATLVQQTWFQATGMLQ